MKEQIRTATEADVPGIVALVLALAREDRGVELDAAAIASAVALCLKAPGCDLLTAELEGTIVGYTVVHWIPFPMLQGIEGYISDLIVGAALRGRGVGGRLMAEVEHRARERGCVRLMLNNRIAAESFSRGFYTKLGFRHRGGFANMVKMME